MGSDPRKLLWMLLVPVHGEPALDCFPRSRAQQLPELVVLATSETNKTVFPRLTPSFQIWKNKPNQTHIFAANSEVCLLFLVLSMKISIHQYILLFYGFLMENLLFLSFFHVFTLKEEEIQFFLLASL